VLSAIPQQERQLTEHDEINILCLGISLAVSTSVRYLWSGGTSV
jgi:hypothetical protein